MGGMLSLLYVRQYFPPTRTSISQETSVMGTDFGTHQRFISSGRVHASKTMRAGALNVRVTMRSRSDFRTTVVRLRVDSPSFSSMAPRLLLEFFNDLVQFIEANLPPLPVDFEPSDLVGQAVRAESAGSHAPDLFRGDEPGVFQDPHVLLHARQRHAELVGEARDRCVRASQLHKNTAAGDVRQRGKGGIETGVILNHVV